MTYFEILTPSEGVFKDKGSKFYAFAFPVTSREEVAQRLTEVRKKYHDARHHCYAFRIGNKGETFFANDDGEPAHSAGDPILGQIRSKSLTNILIVVVRYFGGVLLGVRGLIDAYKAAAEEALIHAQISEIVSFFVFSLSYPYEKTNEINRLLHPFKPKIIRAEYLDTCKITLQVPESLQDEIYSIFENLYAVKLQIER